MKYARVHVLVSGDVKDQSFRYFAREKSKNLNLRGWIKDHQTGEVEFVLEGLEERVKEMVEWCKKGPCLFRDNCIQVEFSEFVGEFEKFEIRH